jgi:hypothetical protein
MSKFLDGNQIIHLFKLNNHKVNEALTKLK